MAQRVIGGPKSRRRLPFHVVPKKMNGVHIGYDIYVNNLLFLTAGDTRMRLMRHEAYAICKLLNYQKHSRKWAQKFGDPYV